MGDPGLGLGTAELSAQVKSEKWLKNYNQNSSPQKCEIQTC